MREDYLYMVIGNTSCHYYEIGSLIECENEISGLCYDGKAYWYLYPQDVVEIGEI